MDYRKFQGEAIFSGMAFMPENMVLITGKEGKVIEMISEDEAGDDIEKFHGILSPGFINCHCHLELSHMKRLIPEKSGLVDFVLAVVTQRHFPKEEIIDAIEKAENEMLTAGIVAVGDICNNLLTLPQKLKRNLAYYNFIEASGWLPSIAVQRIERSNEYLIGFSETMPASIVPHAPYSVSADLWELLKPFFKNKVATIHNQETSFEDNFFMHKAGDFLRMYKAMNIETDFYKPSGKRSVQSYYHNLMQASKIILVHNTFIQQQDIDFIKEQNKFKDTYLCLCPNANEYIEDAFPPVEMFIKNDCNIVLGTDSLASNRSLSILDEMKTIHKHLPKISLEQMLSWATINGAKALEMASTLGSFENGKIPGVVLIKNVDAESKSFNSSSSITRLL